MSIHDPSGSAQNPFNSRANKKYLAGLLFGVLVINILFLPGQMCPGDATAWRQETFSIVHFGRLWIDPRVASQATPGKFFVLNERDGHYYSKYGIVNALMAAPPMEMEWLLYRGGGEPESRQSLIYGLWDTLQSLALAVTMFIICRRYSDDARRCALYVVCCFYCTFLWSYLRNQGGEIYQALFFALFYECLLRGRGRLGWLAAAWFFMTLLVFTRPFFAVLVPACAVLSALQMGTPAKRVLVLLLPPLVIVGLIAVNNDVKFGAPWLTGYTQWKANEHLPVGSLLDGGWGFLFADRWSIFIYFPMLLVAAPFYPKFWTRYRFDSIVIATVFLVSLLTLGRIPTWRGEWTYGPRYLLFVLPIMSLPALLGDGTIWRIGSAAILIFSFWLQIEVVTSAFFFCYYVQLPLDGSMDTATAEYFLDHPEGAIIHDFYANGEASPLLRHLRETLPTERYDAYWAHVRRTMANTNLYWWPPR